MAVKLRLTRGGAKKRPYYRIVAADNRSPRDGRFIEILGTYNPILPSDHPERLTFKEDRVRHWLSVGAQPTDRVARMCSDAGLIEPRPRSEQTKKSQPKAKAQARQREAAEAAAAAQGGGESAAEPA